MSYLHREATVAARMELARLAARFLDHRRENGSYPESPGGLRGGPAPPDPLSGQPFSLLREGGALFLASPGNSKLRWRLP